MNQSAMSDRWLDGRRALIVGAGSGIGRGVAQAFDAAGASLALLDIDQEKCDQLTQAHPDAVIVAGDASLAGVNRDAVSAAVDRFGGLDVLVHCVGVFDFYRGIESLDVDEIDQAFEEINRVNVLSTLHAVKASVEELRRSKGSILLTGSTSSFRAGRGGVLYVASKFAVRGLVVTLAHELAPDIRVNGVAPGGTLGTDLRGLSSLDIEHQRLDDEDRAESLRRRTQLEVALTPEDHAGSYVFLASDRARGITGTFVHSDGGVGIVS